MPTPISGSSNSAPSNAPPAVAPPINPPSPPVVTIDPVVIEGDAGTRELVKRHAATSAAPNCRQEKVGAGVGAVGVGGGVLATLAAGAAGGPLGIAAALVTLFGASLYEGTQLRALENCRKP